MPWGCFHRGTPPPNMEKVPLLRIRGIIDPPNWGGLVVRRTEKSAVRICFAGALWLSPQAPVVHDWVNKGGMSCRVSATGHIKDPMPLIKKRRGLCPRFPPSFIRQYLIIITGLNKLYNCMFSPWRWPYMPTGRKTPLKLLLHSNCYSPLPPLFCRILQ